MNAAIVKALRVLPIAKAPPPLCIIEAGREPCLTGRLGPEACPDHGTSEAARLVAEQGNIEDNRLPAPHEKFHDVEYGSMQVQGGR